MAAGDLALNIIINANAGNVPSVVSGITQALSGLGGGAGAAGNAMGALGTAVGAAGGAMAGIATVAVGVTAAIVGIGASATKMAGDFQQATNTLITSAGESQKNIQMVSDGIKQMAVDTGTSTQSLVSAMYNIESGGQHGADGLKILQVASEGAKTENADLTTVTKALMTTMADYHLPAEDASAAMNGLIAAVKNGRTTLQDMASAMGQVLPIASSLGISFPKVAGALDALTNAGVTAQQGAQNLAHWFTMLEAPSGVAQKSMAAVGLSAQELKDTLVTKGLPAALQLIEDHIGQHLPAGSIQAETAMKNITGGLVGLKTAAAITSQGLQATTDATNKIAEAFDKGGAAVDGWDVVQQGFNFQMDRAKQALDVFMITLGQKLLPILTPIIKGFADFVTGITNFVSGLSNAAGSSDTFVKTLTSMGVNAQTARDIFNDLSTTFHIIGDIAANVGNILQTIFGGAFKIVGGLIIDFINGPLGDIIQGFNGVLSGIDDFTKSIVDDFTNLSSNANTWGQNLGISFENGLISVAADIIAVAEQIAQGIADYLGFQSPTKKGPGSTLAKWGIGMVSGLAQGIIAAGPAVTNAVLAVASQLQTASSSGGILHTAVASMIDPLSGDAMHVTATPDPAISHPSTGLNTTALKSSATAATSHSATATTASAIVTAVKSSATAVSSAVAAAASRSAAHKSATSKAAASQRTAAMAQKAKTSAASAQQRSAHAAAAAKARQHAAQQRAAHTAAMQKAHQHAAQQRQAAAQQRAQHHAAAQAKREQIHQALLAQRAQKKAAAAAAKAGPPAVAGAMPKMDLPSLSNSLDNIKKKITDAFAPLKDAAANAKLLQQNISNSFTGIQAKAQELRANLKQFFDWLNRTFAPVWAQISDTWNNHIIPDLAKIKKAFDDASPSLKLIVKILGQLLALGVIAFFQNLADSLYIVDYLVERLTDGLTLMVQGWLWVQQQLKPVYDWIVQGLQWVYDQIIGHSIIPDLINGIETWFNKLLDFFPTIMGKIKSTLVQWWNQIKTDVTTFWQNVQSIFSSAWTTYIQKPLQTLMTNLTSWWNTLKTSAVTWAKNVWTAITTIFQQAWSTYIQKPLQTLNTNFQQWFTTEATQFGTWATNLIKMFAQGLTTGATTILQPAVNAVATIISNFIAIKSPAAMGPLSKSDTWMPNLMKMFSRQITAGTPQVTSATNNMAVQVQNAINQMSQKVQQSVSDMMQKISQVGQSLSQMQSQVSSAVGQMRADVQAAVTSANMALTNMQSTVSSAVSSMNSQIASVGQSLAQMQQEVTQAISQASQSVQNAAKSMEQSLKNVQSQSSATTSQVRSDSAQIDTWLQQNKTASNQAVQSFNKDAQQIGQIFQGAAQHLQTLTAMATQQQQVFSAIAQYMMSQNDKLSALVATAAANLSRVEAMVAQAAAAVATGVASFMGHSEPKQGPMAGDSQWGTHFMENFIGGMQSKIPELANASQSVATKIVENLLPNTKAMANDIKASLAQAATATGDTITKLKQKGDDIYATIQALTSLTGGTAGTPGTAATYALTTANVAGDIPVQYQLTPPTPGTAGTSGTQTTQNMTVHIDLDGKTLGKYVGKYIQGEIHVQGGVRGR